MGAMLRVVGVGSPHGDDRVGWWLAERLAQRVEVGDEFQVACVASPLDLVEGLEGVGTLIVADAVHGGGGAPGTVVIRQWPDEDGLTEGLDASTHGLGVIDALRLAVVLRRLPGRVILFGVEASEGALKPWARHGEDRPGPDLEGEGTAATTWPAALVHLEDMVRTLTRLEAGRRRDE
jgi:hydrogenase maturation protease